MNLDETHPWGRGDATGHERQCRAHVAETGDPCRAFAIAGGTVCVYHGGASPQVREAARRRNDAVVPEALRVRYELMRDPEVPAAVRLRAVQDVLDRAGTKAPDVLDVTVGPATERPDLDEAIAQALRLRGAELPAIEATATEDARTD